MQIPLVPFRLSSSVRPLSSFFCPTLLFMPSRRIALSFCPAVSRRSCARSSMSTTGTARRERCYAASSPSSAHQSSTPMPSSAIEHCWQPSQHSTGRPNFKPTHDERVRRLSVCPDLVRHGLLPLLPRARSARGHRRRRLDLSARRARVVPVLLLDAHADPVLARDVELLLLVEREELLHGGARTARLV